MNDILKKLYFGRIRQYEKDDNEKSEEHLMWISKQESELLQTLTPVKQK